MSLNFKLIYQKLLVVVVDFLMVIVDHLRLLVILVQLEFDLDLHSFDRIIIYLIRII
jgi:hypothetical protein